MPAPGRESRPHPDRARRSDPARASCGGWRAARRAITDLAERLRHLVRLGVEAHQASWSAPTWSLRRKVGREYILHASSRSRSTRCRRWIAKQQAFWARARSRPSTTCCVRTDEGKAPKMTETLATAKVTHRFSASPERVYDAWLEPAKLRAWMSAGAQGFRHVGRNEAVEIDARVGGKFLFSDMREAGEAKHWGTYRVLDRPRTIEFTWIVDREPGGRAFDRDDHDRARRRDRAVDCVLLASNWRQARYDAVAQPYACASVGRRASPRRTCCRHPSRRRLHAAARLRGNDDRALYRPSVCAMISSQRLPASGSATEKSPAAAALKRLDGMPAMPQRHGRIGKLRQYSASCAS